MVRKRLYIILSVIVAAGYVWLALNRYYSAAGKQMPVVCLFKHTTGIPCPACGSTRSAIALMKGDLMASLSTNPIGVVVSILMLIIPVWLAYDLLQKKDSLFRVYISTEALFNQKKVAIASVILIAANWVWNIAKGL